MKLVLQIALGIILVPVVLVALIGGSLGLMAAGWKFIFLFAAAGIAFKIIYRRTNRTTADVSAATREP
jgi:hypothetical protein